MILTLHEWCYPLKVCEKHSWYSWPLPMLIFRTPEESLGPGMENNLIDYGKFISIHEANGCLFLKAFPQYNPGP